MYLLLLVLALVLVLLLELPQLEVMVVLEPLQAVRQLH
jgi:hypothetical protein